MKKIQSIMLRDHILISQILIEDNKIIDYPGEIALNSGNGDFLSIQEQDN